MYLINLLNEYSYRHNVNHFVQVDAAGVVHVIKSEGPSQSVVRQAGSNKINSLTNETSYFINTEKTQSDAQQQHKLIERCVLPFKFFSTLSTCQDLHVRKIENKAAEQHLVCLSF